MTTINMTSYALPICRILVVKGTVIVLWKMLTPAVFDYKASCDSQGHTIYEHITGGKLTELLSQQSSSSEKAVLEGIQTLRNFTFSMIP